MKMRRLPSGSGAWLLSLAVAACGGVDNNAAGSPIVGSPSLDGSTPAAAPGAERGACYGNGTCDHGLTCASNLCVKLPASGAGGAPGASGHPSNGGASYGGASAGGQPSASGGPGAGGTDGLDASMDASGPDAGSGGVDGASLCAPGALQCNGVQVQLCDSRGTWQDHGAPCDSVCIGGACTGCLVGAQQCDGNVPHYCDTGGIWRAADTCPFACVAGTCTGVCVPLATECNGNSVQTCHATGQWGAPVACVDQQCQNGVCI